MMGRLHIHSLHTSGDFENDESTIKFFSFQYLPLIEIAIYACHRARFCFCIGIIKRIAQVLWKSTEKTFRQILSWNWNFQWNYPKNEFSKHELFSNCPLVTIHYESEIGGHRIYRIVEMMKLNLDMGMPRNSRTTTWTSFGRACPLMSGFTTYKIYSINYRL